MPKRRWIVSPNAWDCVPTGGSRGAKGTRDEGVGTGERTGTGEMTETVDGAVEWIRWGSPVG